MSVAFYRKYRSKKLSEVVGQKHITDVLDLALKQEKIAHAYLFTGPRGVGKTSIARILAHEINNLPYSEESEHPDIIEIDAASNNSVEDIRDLREKIQTAPFSAKFRIYIIDEVHMLSKSAFNALLKTLEEPPKHTIFILATTDSHKLPATIISRTQQFVFHFIDRKDICEHLAFIAENEGVKISPEALEIIAEKGGGSFRDSISLLDQISSVGRDEEISAEKIEQILGLAPKKQILGLIENFEKQNIAEIIAQIEKIKKSGVDLRSFCEQFIAEIKNLLAQKPWLVNLLNPLNEAKNSNFLELELLSILILPKDFPQPKIIVQQVSSQPNSEEKIAKLEPPKLEKIADKPNPEIAPKEPSTEAPKNAKTDTSETAETKTTKPAQKPKKPEAKTPANQPKPERIGERNDFEWRDFLKEIKKASPAIGGILAQSGHEITEDTIKIYAGYKIKKTQLDKQQNRTIISQALEKIGAGDWFVETFAEQKPPEDPTAAAVFEIMGGGEEVELNE